MFLCLYYIKMAVKKVASKVVKKPTKVVEKIEEQLEAVAPTKSEELEFHLSKFDSNSLSKQEIRAIFASLFR